MSNSIKQRLRRNRKTRIKISNTNRVRLSVHRTNLHIYAQLLDANGSKILASIDASNGVVHVVDDVFLPPAEE
jgi:large subunit ribosomal protein L18